MIVDLNNLSILNHFQMLGHQKLLCCSLTSGGCDISDGDRQDCGQMEEEFGAGRAGAGRSPRPLGGQAP